MRLALARITLHRLHAVISSGLGDGVAGLRCACGAWWVRPVSPELRERHRPGRSDLRPLYDYISYMRLCRLFESATRGASREQPSGILCCGCCAFSY